MSSIKTSFTAFCVVAGLDKLARMPRWRVHFDEDMIRLNHVFVEKAQDTLAKRLLAKLPTKSFLWMMNNFFIPGMTEHFLLRKKYIEAEVKKAIAEGTKQVIVMGAGFDTLAIRLAKQYPQVHFFEIDLPQTQRAKRRMLGSTGELLPVNCFFKEIDLANTTVRKALADDNHLQFHAHTIVILEGVLMYLAESEVTSLFETLRAIFTGDMLKIVFGAIAVPDKQNGWRMTLSNLYLTSANEETKWSCSSNAMPSFLSKTGYRLLRWNSYKSLQRAYRFEQEIAAVPEEDENYYVAQAGLDPTDFRL